MKLGLIGIPQSGKTTIFNSLTANSSQIDSKTNGRGSAHRILVTVLDKRIDDLSSIYHPKKMTYASIELVDFPGLAADSRASEELTGQIQQLMHTMDGLAVVLRNYADEVQGPADPVKELGKIEDELMVIDLISVEKRLEKIQWSQQRGKMTMELQREERILQRALDSLNNSIPIRKMLYSDEELKMIRGFQFLSQKPLLVILNSAEASYGSNNALVQELNSIHDTIEFAGKFEMDLAGLDSEEAHLFMEDLGIAMSARERLTQMAYRTLGLISFFTVGDDEVRAWTIHRGETAFDAAGTIHSDLARGFIRASCFACADLLTLGSEKKIKEKGLCRLEGKDYIVPDGTVIEIKFNV
jgi:ribosome-binding ATPase